MQEFQNLSKVVSLAFGGGGKKDVSDSTPKNFADAQARLNQLLGRN